MSGIEIETRFNAAVSRLMAVLGQEDSGQVLDGTRTMQLLAEVKPRTARPPTHATKSASAATYRTLLFFAGIGFTFLN